MGVGGRGGVPDFIRDEEARHHPGNVEITDNGDRSRPDSFWRVYCGGRDSAPLQLGLGWTLVYDVSFLYM